MAPIRPLTQRELRIPAWPPSLPWDNWLERVVVAPWERWDAVYYVRIVRQGYRIDDGTAQFHPLLPWLATPVARLTGQPLLALLLVSSMATLLLLLAFERLARLDLKPAAARTSTLLLMFSPPAVILFAPYTESLWLLCAVLCLWWARKRQWLLAGIAGACAALARQQGVFLLLPVAWELWEASRRDKRSIRREYRNWLALALIPGGLLIWLTYRAIALADLQIDWSHPQSLIYSLLISASANKVVPHQAFYPPWQAFGLALVKYVRSPDLDLAIDLLFAGVFLCFILAAWRELRTSYRIYVIVIALVSFSYYTGPFHPYMGLPRHLLLAFPVFIGLGMWIKRPLALGFTITVGVLGMAFFLFLYVLQIWVP
ncbi:MAG: glycosyltransferase family 39 protein [Herpetosiphonaceae bacterium]|nr:glycosyltransferase family 39 protein [Herpetosiphonaceae bacterium]